MIVLNVQSPPCDEGQDICLDNLFLKSNTFYIYLKKNETRIPILKNLLHVYYEQKISYFDNRTIQQST